VVLTCKNLRDLAGYFLINIILRYKTVLQLNKDHSNGITKLTFQKGEHYLKYIFKKKRDGVTVEWFCILKKGRNSSFQNFRF
jgi:hypothetical protein